MIHNSDYFDLSGYDKNHPCYKLMQEYCEQNGLDFETFKNKNKKTPSKFKDECPNDIITEVIAIKSKVYSILK